MEKSLLHRKEAGLRSMVAPFLLRLWYADADAVKERPLFPLLSHASTAYNWLLQRSQRRASRNSHRLPAQVISVGNLVAGGTGKTPFTIWLAEHLQQLGWRVAILSRGYGGKTKTSAQVPNEGELSLQSSLFGDEPVLLSRRLAAVPVWVGRKRRASGQMAIEFNQAEVLVLDDGFQHLWLQRDLDFVLLDSRNPFGNRFLLPLWPLREPIDHLQRCDAIILTWADDAAQVQYVQHEICKVFPTKPIFCCQHRLAHFTLGLSGMPVPVRALKRLRVVAFAGIAKPDSFFNSLSEAGILPLEHFAFPDHHAYTQEELLALLQFRTRSGAHFLITTEKDCVRLPPELCSLLVVAHLRLDFGADHQAIYDYLIRQLGRSNK
jgi:tetraacyldisaccharide 4'-kinase